MFSLIDQTRSKIDGLLATIDGLQAVDYPFSDASHVLEIIAEEFGRLRADLTTDNPDTNAEAAKTLCRRAGTCSPKPSSCATAILPESGEGEAASTGSVTSSLIWAPGTN